MSAPRYEGDLAARHYADAFLRSAWLTKAEREQWYQVHRQIPGPISEAWCAGIAARQRLVELQARVAAKQAALGMRAGVKVRKIRE